MSYQLKRLPIGQGVYFSSISDPKFKHNRISVNFIVPLEEATASDNAIIPFLLRKGCKSCPDYTALEQKLCQLYGASLDADVSKFGQYQILSVSIQSVDDRFALNNENLSRDCAELLADIAFDPKISGGSFDELDFKLEQAFLIDTIAAEINDKRGYALTKCKSYMCQGEASAIRKYGDMESAKKITAKSAATAYRRLADTAAIEIMFVGSGSPDDALEIFSGLFAGMKRPETNYETCPRKATVDQVREYTEEMEISQSKLVMGFRTGETLPYDKLGPLRMMSALFGGTPFSRLFVNVREKLSLCYYCAARFDISNGILMVDSGVEAQNRPRAQEEILAQLEVLKKGEFTDQELASTKLAIVNSLRSTGDSLGGIESWYLTQILMGSNASPAQEVELMSKITKEQVVAAANKVTLDTVYFLTSKGGENQ